MATLVMVLVFCEHVPMRDYTRIREAQLVAGLFFKTRNDARVGSLFSGFELVWSFIDFALGRPCTNVLSIDAAVLRRQAKLFCACKFLHISGGGVFVVGKRSSLGTQQNIHRS